MKTKHLKSVLKIKQTQTHAYTHIPFEILGTPEHASTPITCLKLEAGLGASTGLAALVVFAVVAAGAAVRVTAAKPRVVRDPGTNPS